MTEEESSLGGALKIGAGWRSSPPACLSLLSKQISLLSFTAPRVSPGCLELAQAGARSQSPRLPPKMPQASLAGSAHLGLLQQFGLSARPKLERGALGTGIGDNLSQGEDVPALPSAVSILGLTCTGFYAQPCKLYSEPQDHDFKKRGPERHARTHAHTHTPHTPDNHCPPK